MRIFRVHSFFFLFPLLIFFCLSGHCYAATDVLRISPQPPSASVGVQFALTISAIDTSTNVVDKDAAGKVSVTVIGGSASGSATAAGADVIMTAGNATVFVTFDTPGMGTVSASIAGATPATPININVTTSVAGCSSCFLSIGAGAVLTSPKGNGDYNDVTNILETTHLGTGTPQYLAGVAYKLPFHEALPLFLRWRKEEDADGKMHRKYEPAYVYSTIGCSVNDFTVDTSDARAAFCYPYKIFVNFKFTPDASQTFNGFTYGLSHAIHKDLDILLGVSYSAYNEVSPGFQAAAVQVVKAQQAPSTASACYAQWNLTTLQANHLSSVAFDGFPTQLLTQTGGTASAPICTAGAQIYGGSPLVTHYHPGLFIGVSIPVGFSKILGGK